MSTELEQETRQQLAAAIESRDAVGVMVNNSHAALTRAWTLVSALQSELAQDDAHAATRHTQSAESLAARLRHGDAAASAFNTTCAPTDAREAAQTRFNVATTARDQLRREADALTAELMRANGVVRQHALVLIRIEADRIAAAIEQEEAKLFAMRTKLRGVELSTYQLAAAGDGTWQRPLLLTARAAGALLRPDEPQACGGHNPAKDSAAQWKRFYDALMGDARATLCS